MNHRNRDPVFVALAILAIVAIPAAATAGSASTVCLPGSPWAILGISTDAGSNAGCLPVLDAGVTTITIGVVNSLPIKKVRFSLGPLPAELIVLSQIPDQIFVGDLETGIEFDLGGCVSGPVTLMTILVLNVTPLQCTLLEFEPYGPTGEIEAVTCDDAVKPASGLFYEIFSQSQFSPGSCNCEFFEPCIGLPPTDLFPADGAIEVPTDVVMSWPAQPYNTFMYIGTDPNCNDRQFIGLGNQTTFAPDFLVPSTTYYWQLGSSDGICGELSGIQAFTTVSTVATETQTWGAIKATYR